MAFSIVYENTGSLLLFLREIEVAAHKSIVIKLKQQSEHLQEDNRRHEKVCKKKEISHFVSVVHV